MEALSSAELLDFIIYDTISATPPSSSHDSDDNAILTTFMKPPPTRVIEQAAAAGGEFTSISLNKTGTKKRRKRAKVCKNKEEAEAQRMTHITVERNRRKQMNEHLAVLRSLMPDSYAQRGDQATIVGGAIEYVKELEQLLQSLEAQKVKLLEQERGEEEECSSKVKIAAAAFAEFFKYPQYTWSQIPTKMRSKCKADIEVTLIESHASLRILSVRSLRHLSKLLAAFHTLRLSILHLSLTTAHPLVLYSISAKVEEGCQLSSVDDIAAAVHHMLGVIEHEACVVFN